MALLHRASITPSKSELVAAWLPRQPWAPPSSIRSGVSYRLDDPAGEVGMEAFLLTSADGLTVHVPLTYRGSPLAGAEAHLVGTMMHSVLGTRWVYDGEADPVWTSTVATVIATGGRQADEVFEVDGRIERREPAVQVRGARGGDLPSDTVELVLVRRIGTDPRCPATLTATWEGGSRRGVLAGLRRAP